MGQAGQLSSLMIEFKPLDKLVNGMLVNKRGPGQGKGWRLAQASTAEVVPARGEGCAATAAEGRGDRNKLGLTGGAEQRQGITAKHCVADKAVGRKEEIPAGGKER